MLATAAQIDSGVLSGKSKPASCSISRIFPSMPEERVSDKVTNVFAISTHRDLTQFC
jgi:hypothetical protein